MRQVTLLQKQDKFFNARRRTTSSYGCRQTHNKVSGTGPLSVSLLLIGFDESILVDSRLFYRKAACD